MDFRSVENVGENGLRQSDFPDFLDFAESYNSFLNFFWICYGFFGFCNEKSGFDWICLGFFGFYWILIGLSKPFLDFCRKCCTVPINPKKSKKNPKSCCTVPINPIFNGFQECGKCGRERSQTVRFSRFFGFC